MMALRPTGPRTAVEGTSPRSSPLAIGRYQIRQELGRGMMGIVYLAQDPVLDRLIALKTIDLAFAVPPAERGTFEQRFLTEARVAARLAHPGIVVVHDVGRDEAQGILYIALEYLQGRTLAELAPAGQRMEWRMALRIVARVARALHHAHRQGIVHRDVKPANIMVLPSGDAKIMDFGIAKVPHLELTSAGQFFGTPLYMSPEQAAGEPVDGRSDLFSLGAVAYLLLTGQQAFKADNVLQVLTRVTNDHPRAATHLAPELPAEIDLLLERALAKEPARRYPTGEVFACEVEELLAGRSIGDLLDLPLLDEEPFSSLVEEPPAALEEPLAAVLDAPPAEVSAVRRSVPEAGSATQTTRSPQVEARVSLAAPATATPMVSPLAQWADEPPARRGRLRWAAWIGVGLAGAIGLGLAVRSGDGAKDGASPPPVRTAAGKRSEAAAPRSDPMPAPAGIEAATAASAEPARLVVDFEHHLRSGNIKVWVDEELVLDEALDSRVTRKILSVRLRKGQLEQVLTVAPGRHEVRVRVHWGNNTPSKWITGNFESGQTRQLEVRVSRVFNELSLKWR